VKSFDKIKPATKIYNKSNLDDTAACRSIKFITISRHYKGSSPSKSEVLRPTERIFFSHRGDLHLQNVPPRATKLGHEL